jgi:hypothetical protein
VDWRADERFHDRADFRAVGRNENGDTSIWFMNGASVSSVSDLGLVPSSWMVQAAGAD